jgi:FkbM family methyltransferase
MDNNFCKELEKIFNTPAPDFKEEFIGKKIILYGAGSLGHMAVDLLNKKGITPEYIVDKSIIGNIKNIKIVKPDEISSYEKKNALFLICISSLPYNEIENYLKGLQCNNIMHFYTWAYLVMPELLENGWFITNLSTEDKEGIKRVCQALSHNEYSLSHYIQFLWWKICQKEIIFSPVLAGKKYFKSPCFSSLGKNEVLLDGGTHFGQTIDEFIKFTNNDFKRIYSFEPDISNLQTAQKYFRDERIFFSSKALYDRTGTVGFINGMGFASKIDAKGVTQVDAVKIDDLDIEPPTIIKLHIEGNELEALNGGVKTISKHHPVLMILADHNEDGLWKIPLFIESIGDYCLYFYLHDYCGNTAVYYAIPKRGV